MLKEQKDVKAAVNYLKSRGDVDSEKIGALGFSLSASTFLITDTDIKAIVAESPYANLDAMISQSYKIFPGFTKIPFVWITRSLAKIVFGMNTEDISPENSIQNLNVPVLLIHGEKDSQIPVENSKKIYELSNKNITELWLVENADHGQVHYLNSEEYEKKILKFFQKHLKN